MNDDHFREDVRSTLTGDYTLEDGRKVKGIAVSFLLKEMRGQFRCSNLKSKRMWRGLGALGDFEFLLRQKGFKVSYRGRNNRGQKTIVVHEETSK